MQYIVLGKRNAIIGVWKRRDNASFTWLGEWYSELKDILSVDLYSDFIIVHGWVGSNGKIHVFHCNGNRVWTTEDNVQILKFGVHKGHSVAFQRVFLKPETVINIDPRGSKVAGATGILLVENS